jgi:hypothetical protein
MMVCQDGLRSNVTVDPGRMARFQYSQPNMN